jgi:hypothetical protein
MKKFTSIATLLLFKLVLDLSYINFVHPVFGEFILDISRWKVAESYILVFILGILIARWFNHPKYPSSITIYIIVLNLITPLLSYYGLTDSPRSFIYMVYMSIIIVMLIVKNMKPLKITVILEGKYIFGVIAVVLSFAVFSHILLTGGLSRMNFNVLEVYDVREDFNASSGMLMGYFLPWVAYSINSLLMGLYLYRNNYKAFVFIACFQLFIFSTTGHKSFLFAPFLVLVIHFLINKIRVKNLFPFLASGFIFLILFGLVKFNIQNDLVNGSIFIRRNFFVPALIHFQYYDFFQSMPFVKLSNSIFGMFIDYPYGEANIVHVVSNHYYHREFGLNVGYIGNAYMNFGFMGVLTFSILLGCVLKLLDSFSKNIPVSLAISSIAIPSMAFVNAGLLTALLTHGFGLSLFLLWMIAEKKKLIQEL